MTIAYSYIRFSHRSQAAGDSIRRQTAAVAEWCRSNGVTLDTATTFQECHSAFLGQHYSNPDRHALAAFLEMSKPGEGRRIPPGSYLIIENLDRLTREHIQPALLLVLTILQSGIRIVQLKPEIIFDDKSDTLPIMMMIVELSRGHSESAMKSDRVGKAWNARRLAARENGKPFTSCPPPWLSLDSGAFKEIPSIADIYRRIFRLCREGHGYRSIAAILNREGVDRPDGSLKPKASTTGKPRWTVSYISEILNDRRLLGEHELKAKVRGFYRKTGETIPGLYPAIISESEWDLAKEGSRMRKLSRGRGSPRLPNLFKSLLFNPIDGGTYINMMRREPGARAARRVLVNVKSRQEGAAASSFSYDVFEYAFLSQLQEIPIKDLLKDEKAGDKLGKLTAKRDKLERRREEIENAMAESDESVLGLAKAHNRLVGEIGELGKQIASERCSEAAKSAEEIKEGMTIADELRENPHDITKRTKLHAILRRWLEGIWMIAGKVPKSRIRFCVAQVRFRDNPTVRTYVMWHRPAHVAVKSHIDRPEEYYAESEPKQFRKINLRDAASAKRVLSHLPEDLESPSADDWIAFPVARRTTP